MIEALMYGMMPIAITENLRNAPPEKTSIAPKSVFPLPMSRSICS